MLRNCGKTVANKWLKIGLQGSNEETTVDIVESLPNDFPSKRSQLDGNRYRYAK